MYPINMGVDYIKIPGALRHCLKESGARRHGIRGWAAEPKSTRPDRMEFAMRSRITTREQGHVVPECYKLVDEPRNDPFCPTVELRRNTFSQGGNLCDSHEPESKLRLLEIRQTRRTLLPQQEMADIMRSSGSPAASRSVAAGPAPSATVGLTWTTLRGCPP
jgi:hypothetical protein